MIPGPKATGVCAVIEVWLRELTTATPTARFEVGESVSESPWFRIWGCPHVDDAGLESEALQE